MRGRHERGGVKVNGLTLNRIERFHLLRQKGRAGLVYCQQGGEGRDLKGELTASGT